MSDLKDDISYMRNLAEQGRRGTIVGGVFLAAAGAVFGLTCFVQWGALSGRLPAAANLGGYLWLAASAVFAVVFALLYIRFNENKVPGAKGSANAVFGVVWGGVSIGVMIASAAITIIAARPGMTVALYAISPVVFAFYGSAWFTSGLLSRRRWMHPVAMVAYACSLLLGLFSDGLGQLVLMGIALLLTLTVPGIFLMREAVR